MGPCELRNDTAKECEDLDCTYSHASNDSLTFNSEIAFIRRNLDYTFRVILYKILFNSRGESEGCDATRQSALQRNTQRTHAEESPTFANPISEKVNAERTETEFPTENNCKRLAIDYACIPRYAMSWIAMKIWLFMKNIALKITGSFKKSPETPKIVFDKYLESPYLESSNFESFAYFLKELAEIQLEFINPFYALENALKRYGELEPPLAESTPEKVPQEESEESKNACLVKTKSGMEDVDAMPSSGCDGPSSGCVLDESTEHRTTEVLVHSPPAASNTDIKATLTPEKDVAVAVSTAKATLNKDKPTGSVIETTKTKGTQKRSVTFDANVKQDIISDGVIDKQKREGSTEEKMNGDHRRNKRNPISLAKEPKDKAMMFCMFLLVAVGNVKRIIQELASFETLKEFMLQLASEIARWSSELLKLQLVWSTLCELKLYGNQRIKDLLCSLVQTPDYIIPTRKGVTETRNTKELMETGSILQISFYVIVLYAYRLSYPMLDILKRAHFAKSLLRLIQK